MGTGAAKKEGVERSSLRVTLDEMEEAVKIAVRDGSDDTSLNLLVETAIASILSKRPVFPNIAEEPLIFRRYIARWVKEALDDEAAMKAAQDEGLDQLNALLRTMQT